MSLTFHEKSIWISLVTVTALFGFYFFVAFNFIAGYADPDANIVGLFILVVVLVIIVEAVSHTALAIKFRKEANAAPDERDKLIELKATRNAYYLLVGGVWTAGIAMLFTDSVFIIANIIMFFFIVAEIIGFVTQLRYYRQGV